MEAQSPLVGADGRIHLHPKASVDLDVALIVDPGNPEHDYPLWLNHALQNFGALVTRILFVKIPNRTNYFFYRLVKFIFAGSSVLQIRDEFIYICFHFCKIKNNIFFPASTRLKMQT